MAIKYRSSCLALVGLGKKDLMKMRNRSIKAISEFLRHKPCLGDQILDRGELKRVVRACGLTPSQARMELKELGFTLTRNNHGLTIWKRPEDNLMVEKEIA